MGQSRALWYCVRFTIILCVLIFISYHLFIAYSAASGSLNAKHKNKISQQQRDGQIQVNKYVDSMEQFLPAETRVPTRKTV